jgi:hypothetical protein
MGSTRTPPPLHADLLTLPGLHPVTGLAEFQTELLSLETLPGYPTAIKNSEVRNIFPFISVLTPQFLRNRDNRGGAFGTQIGMLASESRVPTVARLLRRCGNSIFGFREPALKTTLIRLYFSHLRNKLKQGDLCLYNNHRCQEKTGNFADGS